MASAVVAKLADVSMYTASGSAILTTGAINTTGATLLRVDFIIETGSGDSLAPTFSDNKSVTTWTCGTNYTGASARAIKTCYAWIASGDVTHVGTGHTVTVAADTDSILTLFSAWTGTGGGASTFVAENGAYNSGFTTAPGSVTPSAAGDLVVSCYTEDNVNDTISPFGTPNYFGGTGRACAWIEAPSTAAINPTWAAWVSNGHIANINVFKLVAAGVAKIRHSVTN